jgi:hypothetical protein
VLTVVIVGHHPADDFAECPPPSTSDGRHAAPCRGLGVTERPVSVFPQVTAPHVDMTVR